MTCSACATRVEKALRRLPGVTEANVNLALERADVRSYPAAPGWRTWHRAVERAGFHARIVSASEEQARADEEHRAREQARLRRELLDPDRLRR
jgi:Cu+-exporting ATPase